MTDSTTMTGLRRGIALLKIMARFPEGCAFRQLQQRMDGLPAATLSRLLKVMIDEGLVAKDAEAGSYSAGTLAFSLSREFLGQVTPAELVQPVLDELARETGHSAALARIEHDGFSYQAVSEVGESFHYLPVGRLNANTVTNGFGLTCLAYADTPTRERFVRVRREFIANQDGEAAYCERLEQVRGDRAYVDATQERMTRFVAPVFRGNEPMGAVGITVPGAVAGAEEQQRFMDAVMRAAERATNAMEQV